MPISVTIDTIVDNILRQHLHHANLSRPSPCRFGRAKVAMLVEFERRKNLRTEKLWPAAVMAECHQRIERVEIPLIRAVIRFKRPKRQQNTATHTIFTLHTVKNAIIALGIHHAFVEPFI